MAISKRKDHPMLLLLASFFIGVIAVSLLPCWDADPKDRGRSVQTHIRREPTMRFIACNNASPFELPKEEANDDY